MLIHDYISASEGTTTSIVTATQNILLKSHDIFMLVSSYIHEQNMGEFFANIK